MAETITGVSSMPKDAKKRRSSSTASAREKAAVAELVKAARVAVRTSPARTGC
ncbi:MAG: hypothetical protein ACRCYU_11035 [Nocardioides sp.]